MMFDDYPIFELGVGDICSLGNIVFPTHGRWVVFNVILRPVFSVPSGMDRWTRQMGDSSPSPMRNHQIFRKNKRMASNKNQKGSAKRKKERNIWIILDTCRWLLLEVLRFPNVFHQDFPMDENYFIGRFP